MATNLCGRGIFGTHVLPEETTGTVAMHEPDSELDPDMVAVVPAPPPTPQLLLLLELFIIIIIIMDAFEL
jgi:hypothetical protein